MIIRISGSAEITHDDSEAPVTDDAMVRELDGAACQDECANYLDSDLADLGITGGTVRLAWDADTKAFRVVTEYVAPRKLTAAQTRRLVDETRGQWSDGIGESCFDDLADRLGVTIDLSPFGQRPTIEQIDEGVKVARPRTALAKAARDGDLETVRKELDAGADTEALLQGYTALGHAAAYSRVEIALELLARGANPHVEDSGGSDPLMTLALSNAVPDADAAQIARALLERGVDPHHKRGRPGYGGNYTPLYIAKLRKKTALAKVLRAFGATQ